MSLLKLKPYALAIAVALALLTNPVCAQVANIGFENGDFSGWTIGGPTGTKTPTSFNGNGAGVSIITGIENLTQGNPNQGGPYTWNVTPLGTYMASLQAANGTGNTFNDMVGGLGLSQSSVTSLTTMLSQQAQATGYGQGNPTNGSWITIPLVLNAGDSFSMSWNYISTDYVPFNDGSITTLVNLDDNTVNGVVNNENAQYALLGFTNPGTGNYSTGSYASTGWQTSTYSVTVAGNYLLGFGSFNLDDTALSPILLVDEAPGQTFNGTTAWGAIAPNEGSSAPNTSSGGSNTPPPPVITTSTDVQEQVITGTPQTVVTNERGQTVQTPVITFTKSDGGKVLNVTKTITTTFSTPITVTTTVTTPVTTIVTSTLVTTTTYSDGNVTVEYGTPEVTQTTINNVDVSIGNVTETLVTTQNQTFNTRVDQIEKLHTLNNFSNAQLKSNILDRHYNGEGTGVTSYLTGNSSKSNKVDTYTLTSYKVGAGADKFITDDWMLGIQYNYVEGKVKGDNSGGKLFKHHLSVQSLRNYNDFIFEGSGNFALNEFTNYHKLPQLSLSNSGKTTGYDYWFEGRVYTPSNDQLQHLRWFVGGTFNYTNINKFTEKGSALTSVKHFRVNDYDVSGEAGIRYDKVFNKIRLIGEISFDTEQTITPKTSVVYNFTEKNISLSASLSNQMTKHFDYTTGSLLASIKF